MLLLRAPRRVDVRDSRTKTHLGEVKASYRQLRLASFSLSHPLLTPNHITMDHQDRRKRAFSQAFQRLSQPRHLDSSLQPAKRISSHSSGSTDVYQQAPLPDQIRTPDVGPAPGTQVRHPQPSNLQHADSIHYDDASLRYKLYVGGLESELTR